MKRFDPGDYVGLLRSVLYHVLKVFMSGFSLVKLSKKFLTQIA